MEVPLNEDFHLICACTYDREEEFDRRIGTLTKDVYEGYNIRKIRIQPNHIPIPFERI